MDNVGVHSAALRAGILADVTTGYSAPRFRRGASLDYVQGRLSSLRALGMTCSGYFFRKAL